MSQCYIHANLVKIHSPVHEISCKQESVTLMPTPTGSAPKTICPPPLRWKIGHGTQTKSALHHVPTLYPCKSGWNLPTSSWDTVHTSTFWLKFGSLSPAVILKIRSRSPKPNQLFIMSQCYIHANLVKIHSPLYEISCKQESVTLTPMPTGSAPKNNMSPSPSVGVKIIFKILSKITRPWNIGYVDLYLLSGQSLGHTVSLSENMTLMHQIVLEI